jgi:hypothetical protein
MAGSYSTSNGQMQDAVDVDILADGLVRFMKVKSDDPLLAAVRERVKMITKKPLRKVGR